MKKILCLLVPIPSLMLSLSALQGSTKLAVTTKERYSEQSEYPNYAWKSSNIRISPKPSNTGKEIGIVETPGIKPLGYTKIGDIKVFRLTAQPVEQTLTDGAATHHQLLHAMKSILGIKALPTKKKLNGWGYNGSTPGPTIELTVGDKVRVIFRNELPEPTLIHWHGLEHPHALDKSSERNPVLPGETHVYEFTAYQEGTYLYHSGCSIAKQNRYGLVGMVIVHPKQYEEPVDRHIALLVQEWALNSQTLTPNTATNQFNWFTLNGHAAPSIPLITLRQGERVRLHVGSMALNTYPLFLHGYTWTLVGTEGGPISKTAQIKGATLHLLPGTTRTIEFTAWNPGTWPLYALTRHQSLSHMTDIPLEVTPNGGIFTLLKVVPTDPDAPWAHHSEATTEEGREFPRDLLS